VQPGGAGLSLNCRHTIPDLEGFRIVSDCAARLANSSEQRYLN